MVHNWIQQDAPEGSMPIALADKIAALFNALTLDDVEAMSPVQRERFRVLCGYWAEQAKPRPRAQAGVLRALEAHQRDE
jgi:hypothetical protein